MAVDEQARHRLYRKLEEVLGPEEAGLLMEHLPPRGFGDLATKGDLELLRASMKSEIDVLRADMRGMGHELQGAMDRAVRRVVQWTSSTVLVGIGLAMAAGRLV